MSSVGTRLLPKCKKQTKGPPYAPAQAARASTRATRDSKYSTSCFAAADNPPPGFLCASDAINPRRIITYFLTASPTPCCCS